MELQANWSTVLTAKLYVDDLTLSASGAPRYVAKLMARVVAYVTDRLENRLGLQISAKKSMVVAGRPSLALATAHAMKDGKVKAARCGKLLGTDAVGGRRRSTYSFRVRLHRFTKTISRYHALRRAGANTKQMVRAMGPPALMYGCEVAGLADTALEVARARVARAAAPEAAGKNPDATLYVLDGAYGTLDPAFAAHVSPLKFWATAWWEQWFPHGALETAFRMASLKIATCAGSVWAKMTGPASAMIASLQRLGWHFLSAREVTDDREVRWSFVLDAPAAIAVAVRQSVRRWRLSKLYQALPALVPQFCDVGAPECPDGTIVVDFAAALGQVMSSRNPGILGAGWTAKWRGDLASAVSGGQWPQARRAAVPAWGIHVSNCQLCNQETGTLEHRFRCRATRPAEGWPASPKQAALILERISQERQRLLQTRALLTLRLPKPLNMSTEWFKWYVEPPDALDDAIWYLDGSLLDGDWPDYRATGYAIVVVSASRDLLAYGNGVPPRWCRSAAAAEAWALFMAVSQCPSPPGMRTDCQALLRTAEAGTARATSASRPLARLWGQISHALDDDITKLVETRKLVWMPAHQTLAAVGNRILSNGKEMSVVDWRANRLVDALAKEAASSRQAPMAITRLLSSGRAAVRHSAALLGRVTHAANNCIMDCTLPDGNVVQRACRDAQQPRFTRKRRKDSTDSAPRPPEPPASLPQVDLSTEEQAQSLRSARATAAKEQAAYCRAQQEWHTKRRIAEIAAASRPPTGRLTGAERLEQLHRRVRARLSSAAE